MISRTGICIPVNLVWESTEDLRRLAGAEYPSTDHRVVPAGLTTRLLDQLLDAHWRHLRFRGHRHWWIQLRISTRTSSYVYTRTETHRHFVAVCQISHKHGINAFEWKVCRQTTTTANWGYLGHGGILGTLGATWDTGAYLGHWSTVLSKRSVSQVAPVWRYGTFLCQVWWSMLGWFLKYRAEKQTDKQTMVKTTPRWLLLMRVS